ncbi:LysR family transcriptional regulator, partial [Mycobacterium tuberculosis]|nr:LysR family transcriptional regulator [Mycobacterium tuberculosis]
MIDLRRRRAVVVLAEEGHVTRAAERLGIQQPPLTRLLQGLEAELGVLLMHRMPRGGRPSEGGTVGLGGAGIARARADGGADVVHGGLG